MPENLIYRIQEIFRLESEKEFDNLALKTFQHQALNCLAYNEFLHLRGIRVESVENYTQIPPLPIEFFKSDRIVSGVFNPAMTFTSSATTGSIPSDHDVKDLSIYEQSFLTGFERVFGDPSEYVILGLLPSYHERPGSSLVYMVNRLISASKTVESGFFLKNLEELKDTLIRLKKEKKRFILFGVSFALVDFAEAFEMDLSGNIVIETGGMKGRKKEMTRAELHGFLKSRFNLERIHSEYGMTEILSQAYSVSEGIFHCPPWMKIQIRDTNDPISLVGPGQTGAVNIIDLANLHSCSFIASDDLGRLNKDESFEILGRHELSDIRGCSLMIP